MSEKKLSGSIALTKLVHVKMKVKGKNGEVLGLFIPLEANMLKLHDAADEKSAVYMPVNLVVRDETDTYGQNGFISKTIESKEWKTLTDEQKEASKAVTPILGNLKDWSTGGSTNDTAGSAADGTVTEHDDLPF